MEEVYIGNQVWMKHNLNVDKFRNGDSIPHAKTVEEWARAGGNNQPAWCYYENAELSGEKYGRLYNWYAVNDPRGLAPDGYHIPSDEEWEELVEYVGGEDEAGELLKSSTGWDENCNGTDEVGFSGLPGGTRYNDGYFDSIGKCGSWWSSTEYFPGTAWYLFLDYASVGVGRYGFDEKSGFSVRCLKDLNVFSSIFSRYIAQG